VQAEHVAAHYERVPAVKVSAVRLPRHAVAKPPEVALDNGAPLLKAALGQEAGELAVEEPGPPLRAGEVRDDRPPKHFEAITHARQQPVKLLVAQVDLAREELADTGLAHTTEAGQAGLGGARFAHHLAEYLATFRHIKIIASYAIDLMIGAADIVAWH
jgi:hypothetical protein